MATATVTKEVELAGIYLEIEAEFDVDWVDNGIGAYEYWGARGVHHDYGWEVQGCEGARIIDDLTKLVTWQMHDMGRNIHNRKFKKARRQWVRKIQRAFDKLDCDDEKLFSNEAINEAASEQNSSEPDPPEPDDSRDEAREWAGMD